MLGLDVTQFKLDKPAASYSTNLLENVPFYPYGVVLNTNNITVGALIGDGVQILFGTTLNANATSILCVSIRSDTEFKADADYPIYDFAEGAMDVNDNVITTWTPLEIVVTVSGDQACAIINRDGIFFPILRLEVCIPKVV